MAKSVRISLANKCQLLFGTAVVMILGAALTVLGVRMQTLVHEGHEETARQLANTWLTHTWPPDQKYPKPRKISGYVQTEAAAVTIIEQVNFATAAKEDPFLAQTIEYFQAHSDHHEMFWSGRDRFGHQRYRYARAIRSPSLPQPAATAPIRPLENAGPAADPLKTIMLVQFPSELSQRQLMLNRIYIVAAGLLAGLLAIGAFWFITTRIILSPVRVLRDTAAKVSQGDLNIRSDINTGDEFEQMSDMFNTMLENLKSNQDQLRTINKSLDLKLDELTQHNVSLYEANLVKGKFLANVSHELRTPLNSIIGFAEVLGESVQDGASTTKEKHKRYITNIITSSRQLLELINDLLDLAKIEAGRMELRVSPLSITDSAEGLINLIRPQAEKHGIELRLQLERDLPLIHTDAGKFQQILFNFLSNAIKFTPAGGIVTLAAQLRGVPATNDPTSKPTLLCVSVSDTGPGIPLDQQDHIFEKFTQLDSTVTREHGGTGLGLAISRELAALLQGQIELHSRAGRGATFSLLIPISLESKSVPLMPDVVEPPTAGYDQSGATSPQRE